MRDPEIRLHVAFEALIDYVRGVGPADLRLKIEEHLGQCAACARSADRLQRVAAITREDRDHPVPTEVIDSAVALFSTSPSLPVTDRH